MSEPERMPRADRKIDRRDFDELAAKVAELEWRAEALGRAEEVHADTDTE